MDYTSTAGCVLDSQGRRQFADRDLENNVPGTDASAIDQNIVRNALVAVVLLAALTPDNSDETLLSRAMALLGQTRPFDSGFAKKIGGYGKGAIVSGANSGQFWVSTAENNQTIPGSDGAAWQDLFSGYALQSAVAVVQNNLTAALASQAMINAHVSTSLDEKLSMTVGGTVHADVAIGDGKWFHTDYIIDNGAGFLTLLSNLVSKGTLSINGPGIQFGGNQTTANNPIGGQLDGTYFDGRTMFLFSNGTTPTYIGSGGARSLVNFYNGKTAVGNIYNNGSSVSFNGTSDYRVKTGIRLLDIKAAANRIQKLRPVRHRWRKNSRAGTTHGFIAHELQEVMPWAVHGEKDAVDEGGKPILQTVDPTRIIPDLVASVQSLMAHVTTLETEVATLKESMDHE